MTKSFPGIKAPDYISSALMKVEVHALLGQNRAGKTIIYMSSMKIAAEYSCDVTQPEITRKLMEGN